MREEEKVHEKRANAVEGRGNRNLQGGSKTMVKRDSTKKRKDQKDEGKKLIHGKKPI